MFQELTLSDCHLYDDVVFTVYRLAPADWPLARCFKSLGLSKKKENTQTLLGYTPTTV